MSVTNRGKKTVAAGSPPPNAVVTEADESKYTKGKYDYLGSKWLLRAKPDSESTYLFWLYTVTFVAAAVRFYILNFPKEVVFDEVHFGKFASYYLQRTYFFDVHPPFAKMLIAFVGYLCGYDGAFKFDDIGLSYEKNRAPYLAYRGLSAIFGTLTVPIMFLTLKEMNFKAVTCFIGSLLVALDNAHVNDSRLILLDATLIISVALSIYCFVKFYKEQLRKPFTSAWFLWINLTGISLSLVISTKYVGVFTFMMIGTAVAFNLWQLLDIRSKTSVNDLLKHLLYRIQALILCPFIYYLFWFFIHFQILTKSGPGDDFMSPEFQQTLGESPLLRDARDLNYHDIITIKHLDTEALLHSHVERYPMRYEDGRISSQGQQVTAYSFEDFNNQWEIIPTKQLSTTLGQRVHLSDVVRFKHLGTNTYLLAHDVASPLYPTNEEITTVPEEEANGERFQQTLFRLEASGKKPSTDAVKTKFTRFKIVHVDTSVALWTHNDQLLPDWGFEQQEVNGNKKIADSDNIWFFDQIIGLPKNRDVHVIKQISKMNFFKKWWEAQTKMFAHNNALSSEHPFASNPESWPGSLSGVAFWNKDSEKKQIYFIGNIVGWWMQVASLVLYVAIVISDLVTRRRQFYVFGKLARDKLYGPITFLFLGWATHYFPFFLMARQKFLHHYLPAHLIASLFSAALWEWALTEHNSLDLDKDEEEPENPYETNPRIKLAKMYFFYAVITAALVGFFAYFAPLTYGNVSLTPEQVQNRKWLDIELHYAK
ncbi:hypothetical protein ACO0RG_002156 [Hanseniaspora osmophila]